MYCARASYQIYHLSDHSNNMTNLLLEGHERHERGQLKWGESFQLLQSTTLAGNLLVSNNRGGAGGFNSNRVQGAGSNLGKGDGVVFCKGYQTGTCQLPSDHYGIFYGVNRFQKHICGNCWLKSKVQLSHPETSDECPLKGQQ